VKDVISEFSTVTMSVIINILTIANTFIIYVAKFMELKPSDVQLLKNFPAFYGT
jgi:hypothetical protein